MISCKYCKGLCIRKGYYKTVQRYRCKLCQRYQQAFYTYQQHNADTDKEIVALNNRCMGINDIGTYLGIAKSVIVYRIKRFAKSIIVPVLNETGQSYEVDELRTFVGDKDNEIYIFYGINRRNRKPTNLVIGSRTKENAKKVIYPIKQCYPKRIYTDGLNIYPSLAGKQLHRNFKTLINRIERKNLTIRTKLKRLVRETICFSKSIEMLEACMKIYFWG